MSDTIFDLVKKEATNLRKFATKKELSNLNFNRLDASDRTDCIYGQMTGNCDSPRAIQLIEESAERVYAAKNFPRESLDLNGSPKDTIRFRYWSPIEVFISQPENQTNDNNKQLVSFLKGKRKTLRFEK